MAIVKAYYLKQNIIISLCSDKYVRVLKRNSYNRFAIEPLYSISKTQSVVLLLFKNGNTIQNAAEWVSRIYDINKEAAQEVVSTIIDRYSGLLNTENVDEDKMDMVIDFKEIKKILTASVLSPSTLKSPVKRKGIPESVVVFISDCCLCDCIYCRVDAGVSKSIPNFMSVSIASKIASECERLGIYDIELTGGDPLTHPQFIEILNIFKEHNVPVAFSTKCPITREKLVKIKEANVSMLQFSIDTIDEDIFTELTGASKQYFCSLHKTVLNAVDLNFDVRIKSVITKININYLISMMESLYKNGVKEFVVQQLSCGDRLFSDKLMPTIDEYIKLEKDMDDLVRKYNDIRVSRAYSIEAMFASESQRKYFRQDCMAGISGIVIQVDGSYAYCGQSFNEELRFLNVRNTDIISAWNSNELKRLISPDREQFFGSQCYTCDEFEGCSAKRCYIRTHRKFGKIFEVDPLCPHYIE